MRLIRAEPPGLMGPAPRSEFDSTEKVAEQSDPTFASPAGEAAFGHGVKGETNGTDGS
jgi:hypothetical protein